MKTKAILVLTCLWALFNVCNASTYKLPNGFIRTYMALPMKLERDSTIKHRHTLLNAREGDEIYFYLRNGGGEMGEGILLLKAMSKSKATITIEVYKSAMSMGALIAIHADVLLVPNDSVFMFHLPTDENGAVATPGSPIVRNSKISSLHLRYFEPKLRPLMDNNQWERFLLGQDIYLPGLVIVEKLPQAKFYNVL